MKALNRNNKKIRLKKSEIVSAVEGMAVLVDDRYVSFRGEWLWIRHGKRRIPYDDMRRFCNDSCTDFLVMHLRCLHAEHNISVHWWLTRCALDSGLTNIANDLFLHLPHGAQRHTRCFEVVNSFGSGRLRKDRYVPNFAVSNYFKRIDSIEQLEKDKMENMIPFIIALDLNVKSLRSKIGKGLWKSLLRNSLKRNQRICQLLGMRNFYEVRDKVKHVELIKKLNSVGNFPKNIKITGPKALMCSRLLDYSNNLKVKERDLDEGIIIDCINMFDQQGIAFNQNWSMNRVKREHDEISRVIAERKIQERHKNLHKEFKNVEGIKDDILPDGCSILRTPHLLALEGLEMGHCVSSYSQSCESGSSIVIKSTSPRATIQFDNSFNFIHSQGKKMRGSPDGVIDVIKDIQKSLNNI